MHPYGKIVFHQEHANQRLDANKQLLASKLIPPSGQTDRRAAKLAQAASGADKFNYLAAQVALPARVPANQRARNFPAKRRRHLFAPRPRACFRRAKSPDWLAGWPAGPALA